MKLYDRYPLDDAAKVVVTKDGYLTAVPRVARTGVQLYYGSELGRVGDDASKIFKVFRPEEEVFATDSMQSFAYKPVTDDHPPESVTVDNWKKYSRGQMSGDVARDGQFIRVPMALMDGDLVRKYKDGKSELSVGYECEIVWGEGSALLDGKEITYDARQKSIRVNHLAVVDAARGGPDLKIGDGTGPRVDLGVYAMALEAIADGKVIKNVVVDAKLATHLATDSKAVFQYPIMKDGSVYLDSLRANKADAVTRGDGDALAALDNLLRRAENEPTNVGDADKHKEATMSKTITVDGLPVEVVNDQAAAIIAKAIDTLTTQLKAAKDAFGKSEEELAAEKKKKEEAAAKDAAAIATKDAQIATLTKQLEDSKVTPALLDQMVKDRSAVAGKASAVIGNALVVDGKTVGEIMRQVVDAKLGDVAKGWTEEQVKISFDTLTASVKPATFQAPANNLADQSLAFAGPGAKTSEALLDARDKRLEDAWKPKKIA
jgi:hypothetical protein